MDDLVEFNPELSTTELLGNSYENRPMRIIKIGLNQNQTTKKPIIWIDAGMKFGISNDNHIQRIYLSIRNSC